MTKVLNLDELSSETTGRELRIKGVSYPIPKMTVDNFIETTRAAEKLEETESVAEQIEATVQMIMRAVPGVPREVLGGYSLETLGKIATFVRGDELEEAKEQLAAAEASAGDAGK